MQFFKNLTLDLSLIYYYSGSKMTVLPYKLNKRGINDFFGIVIDEMYYYAFYLIFAW